MNVIVKTHIKNNFSKSQLWNIQFNGYYSCLSIGDHQKETNRCVLRWRNRWIYPQEVTEGSLSAFVEKRSFKFDTKSLAWNWYWIRMKCINAWSCVLSE